MGFIKRVFGDFLKGGHGGSSSYGGGKHGGSASGGKHGGRGGKHGGGHGGSSYNTGADYDPSAPTLSTGVICSSCSTPNPEGAKFCQQCGNSIIPAFCPQCGAGIVQGAKFCQQCGKGV